MPAEALIRLRSELPDCELAMLADLGSRTVLGWDGALKFPQEQLDSLAATAAELLARAEAADTAIVSTPTEARVFIRAPGGGSEALCAVSAPDAELDRVLAAGRAMMDGLSS